MIRPGNRSARGHRSEAPSPSPVSSVLSWARGHKLLAVLAPAVLIAVVVVPLITLSGGGGKATSASSAPPKLPAIANTVATKGSKWLSGSGAKLLDAVNADLIKVSVAEQAGKQGAAQAAGTQLVTATGAALGGPMPPVAARAYRTALKDLQAAGQAAANGRSGKAVRLLNVGQAGIMKVTAAVDRPVPEKTPAIPEPNGQ
jgi:hypothetical protein